MRLWLSGPRILNGLVRPGISLGREDWRPRLPSWRRYELRKQLQAKQLTIADADYLIDKSLATGALDSAGNLCFAAKGTREEIAEQILERAEAWGQPMTREQAEARTDAAITRRPWPWWGTLLVAYAIGAAIAVWVVLSVFAAK